MSSRIYGARPYTRRTTQHWLESKSYLSVPLDTSVDSQLLHSLTRYSDKSNLAGSLNSTPLCIGDYLGMLHPPDSRDSSLLSKLPKYLK
jgi:hypothetical protein